MKTAIRVGIVAAMIAAAGCTTPEPTVGASGAVACINPIQIHRQDIVSDEEIRFEMRNGDVWANKLKSKCFGLKFEQGFTWDVRGSAVCSNQQTIRVLNSGTSCMLGEFTKVPATT